VFVRLRSAPTWCQQCRRAVASWYHLGFDLGEGRAGRGLLEASTEFVLAQRDGPELIWLPLQNERETFGAGESQPQPPSASKRPSLQMEEAEPPSLDSHAVGVGSS